MYSIWVTPGFVLASNKRSQNESNVWSIFAGVHATGRGEGDKPKEEVAEF
jgi:hypothetical protein